MNDRSSETENYHELKFSREQGFFDKSLSIRLLIGFVFVFTLFICLHFREVRVEVLEFDSRASGYIVSQVDIDFYDEEATFVLKQDAVRDIGKVYNIAPASVRQSRTDFESFLIYNEEWRKQADSSSFDEMYKASGILEKALLQIRFTDPRTIQKMKEVGIPTDSYLIYTPADVAVPVVLPSHIWQFVKSSILKAHPFQPATLAFLVQFFQGKEWPLEEDNAAQRNIKKKIQGKVADKYTHLSAGNRIIDQGEKVTARHIAMLQAMKEKLSENRNLWHPLTLLGSLMMTLLLTGISVAYMQMNQPQVANSNRKLFLLATVVIITLFMSKVTEFFLLTSKSNLIEVVRYPVFVPFAAILLCSLMNFSIATFASGFLALVLTMTLSFDRQEFMIMNLAAAIVAILSTRTLKQRKEIFIVCAKAWLCCVAIIISINFYQNTLWSTSILYDIMSSAFFMLVTAVLVVGLLPLLESTFRIMTDVTLMEYMDPNSDLLRRLTIEAPGTYQHSVVVGNLAETAALAIGANGLFCRVATLYHDVGKMATPQYFTENQHGGMNMHQLLTPKESAQVIMAHVSEGVAMARKAGLPEQFIDIIKEHHGTTLVYYFYRKQLEQVGNDKSLVDERDFRYAGPKPRSKESAIIMIADCVEAASRSLDVINDDTLTELASRLIREKADDGQFDNCLLTFEELAIVKSTLVKTLAAFSHSRIKYPTREKEQGNHIVPSTVA